MRIALFIILIFVTESLIAQRYKSVEGSITFFSDATIEDITATNKKGISIFDAGNGEIAFLVTISDFDFDKSLMKEHFNEKYMESDKYPKATFKGSILGYDSNVKGDQEVTARGALTIHGQTKNINTTGVISFSDSHLTMTASFMVELEDYNIKIPKLLWQNIAERVEVTIKYTYQAL